MEIPKIEKTVDNDAPATTTAESFKNKVPALWNIVATEDGIEAKNSVSSESFVGTMEEFNAKLRG